MSKKYLNEFPKKYAPGTPVKNSTDVLEGTQMLEVPVQNGPVSQEIIDYANKMDPRVIIRDVHGNV